MGTGGRAFLERAKRDVWILISVFTVLMLGHQAWSPTAAQFQHTYELGSPPGMLSTQRGSFDFIVMFSLAFIWLVPLTAALMTTFIGARWIELFHLIITFLLLAWFIAVFVWQLYSLSIANPDPFNPVDQGDRYNNPANDDRWCNVYNAWGVGPPCYLNTFNVTSSPFVGPQMLGINPSYLFSFIMNLILVVLLSFDFFWVMCNYRVLVRRGIILMRETTTTTTKPISSLISRNRNYKSTIVRPL